MTGSVQPAIQCLKSAEVARDLAGGRPGKMAVYEPGPHCGYMGVEPKIGVFTPKMDGLFHGKPY